MFGIQVDLVLGTVKAEADRTLGLTAVKVINEQGLYFLRHEFSIPYADRTIVYDFGGTSTQPYRHAEYAPIEEASEQ